MSLTREESALLDQRDELTTDERVVVDETMDEAAAWGKARNVPLANDDRAAKLEAALIKYIIDSRK